MNRIIAGLALACAAVPASANVAVDMRFECGPAAAAEAGGEPPNLHGAWDFVMDVGETPNFGLLSIGFVGDAYGGSLSLWMTAPVVFREITLKGTNIHMVVASPQGDVIVNGTLSAKGSRICGTVKYHDGRLFPMVAQRRLTTYQSQPQSERTPAR